MQKRVRSAALNCYPQIAAAVGLDPARMLESVGLDAKCLSDEETLIRTDRYYALLERSAAVSGTADFGLRLAQTRRLSNLGVIGLLVREEPTIRDALKVLCAHIHLQNEALSIDVDAMGKFASIVVEVGSATFGPARQVTELAVGVVYKLLWELLGDAWKPLRVCFVHGAPANLKAHIRMFGPRVDFDHEFNGLVCAAGDLDAPVPRSDPAIARYLRRHLQVTSVAPRATTSTRVQQLVWMLMPGGRCTIKEVARRLNMDRRTIHRQLAREAESFSSIVQAVRVEIATRVIGDGEKPMCEVADLLGFTSMSGFCRWFRDQFGVSATAYRDERRGTSRHARTYARRGAKPASGEAAA